ncbi:hypothetical protein UO65_5437 [Actinokineospora spheciospongiae]|uniref:DUF6879 domain-containing protein n=1 Tax=Actinokineospora spheciospongiae TaxID=909613 RepID=W7IEJ8_9PSEU|nr:hypothetical protein UO65_5437 [Actinokineospora spheciospongiae]
METRDRYNSPREAEPYRKFLAGTPDISFHEGWLAMVREATAVGRSFSRVKVVSLPLTDYIRFGMWAAGFTREAGDDIRYLTREQATGLPGHDFWLFDSRLLVRMHFDEGDDRFVGGEIVDDPAIVVEHNYWRDAAKRHAVSRDEFVARYEQRDVKR